jgi:hypothetical protein
MIHPSACIENTGFNFFLQHVIIFSNTTLLKDLNAVFTEEATDYRAFALSWAKTALIYSRLLKLSALLLTVFKENVPLEKLVEFKKT